ncbi:MAG: GatB/YqeY domain-containing protein, partial [Candidatus Moranbacteria bacterium]|nr:GatB/YqeY domain-containing protein [Candidatus Moranbacteria bacterium]
MSLYQTLGDDLKQAMKAGDVFRRDTLRLLQSAVKNVAIDKRQAPADLSDT